MKLTDQEFHSVVVSLSDDEQVIYQRKRPGRFIRVTEAPSIFKMASGIEVKDSILGKNFDIIIHEGFTVSRVEGFSKLASQIWETPSTLTVNISDYFQRVDLRFTIDKEPLLDVLHRIETSRLACNRIFFGYPGKYSRFVLSIKCATDSKKSLISALSFGPSIELPTFDYNEVTENPGNNRNLSFPEVRNFVEDESDVTDRTLTYDKNPQNGIPRKSKIEVNERNKLYIFSLFDEKHSTSIIANNYIKAEVGEAHIIEVGLFRTVLKSQFRKKCRVDEIVDVTNVPLSHVDVENISERISRALNHVNRDVVVIFGSELFEKVLYSNDKPVFEKLFPTIDVNIFCSYGEEIQGRVLALKSLFGYDRKLSANLVTSLIISDTRALDYFENCVYWNFEENLDSAI
jgi:hypothetical protein